ncbi:MAG: hypothetical protein AB1916_09060 [Thermodesulfobacteriota bacterium]
MGTYTISPLPSPQAFDLPAFCELSRAGDLPAAEADWLAGLWESFGKRLSAHRVVNSTRSWLLAWLDESVETEVERLWGESPRRGYLAHCLALSRLMALAADLVPEVAACGCAPVPEPSPEVEQAAADLGLAITPEHTLSRRYALLTPAPYAGGCEICFLRHDCPRLKESA